MTDLNRREEQVVRDFMTTLNHAGETDFFQIFGAYFERFNSEGERTYAKPRPIVSTPLYEAYRSLFKNQKLSTTVDLRSAGVNGKPVTPRYAQNLLLRWERATGFYARLKSFDGQAVLHRGMRLAERSPYALNVQSFEDMILEKRTEQSRTLRDLDMELYAEKDHMRRRPILEKIENFKRNSVKEIEALENQDLPAQGQFIMPDKKANRSRLAEGRSLFPIDLLSEGEIAQFGPFASVPNNEAGVPNYFEMQLRKRIEALSRLDSKEYHRNHRLPGAYRLWVEKCQKRKESSVERMLSSGLPSAKIFYVECIQPVRYGLATPDVAVESSFQDTPEIRKACGVPASRMDLPFSELAIIFRKNIEDWNERNG